MSTPKPSKEARAEARLARAAAASLGREESNLRRVARRFFSHKLAAVGLFVFLTMTLVAIFAPLIAPHNPNQIFDQFQAEPSAEHILGTDPVGRDVLSRLIFGTRVSITVSVGAVAVYVAIGVTLGLVSGYYGRWVDIALMRVTDVFMSFPYFMVILILVAVLGPSLMNITLAIGLLGWPMVARLVRGSVLSIKQSDYVKAGVALGLRTPKILFGHILPNALSPIVVNATFGIASAIILESSLSFLGLGVRPPAASWGNMLSDAQSISVMANQPWLWIPPGVAIVMTVLSVNFVGDGLRDALESRENVGE